MKIHVCDFCQRDGKLVETKRKQSLKGKSFLTIEYCNDKVHAKELPKNAIELVRTRYALDGIELKETDQEIKEKFLRN